MDTLKWQDEALCKEVDPELFFPPKGGRMGAEAKRVCAMCEVRSECLQEALANPEAQGIWGGTTWRQRNQLRRAG